MIFYITIMIGVSIDYLSKNFANIYLQNQINIFSDFLFLKYVENPGIAFSINIPFLKIVTIILIFGIFYYYIKEEKKKKNTMIDIAFGLVLAGAIGNGIERVLQNYVADFIGVKYFAVFNLADSFIFVGACIYIFHTILISHQKNKPYFTI